MQRQKFWIIHFATLLADQNIEIAFLKIDFRVRNVTKDWVVLGIAAPNAEKVLQTLTTEPVDSE